MPGRQMVVSVSSSLSTLEEVRGPLVGGEEGRVAACMHAGSSWRAEHVKVEGVHVSCIGLAGSRDWAPRYPWRPTCAQPVFLFSDWVGANPRLCFSERLIKREGG